MKILYPIIIIQSLIAVAGSLYFSNFWDPVHEYFTGTWFDKSDALEPCLLCVWARIMMYPILPLSILGYIRKSRDILWYICLVSIPGIALETYHYVLQKSNIPNPFGCTAANPCSALKVDYFGFVTIPFMCLIAFVVIFVASIIALRMTRSN